MTRTTRRRGQEAEEAACQYLIKQKLTLVNRNFHCRYGEIDLIMLDDDVLVFVEVRYRKNQYFMDTIESIDARKCQKIITTSHYFLLTDKRMTKYDIRFDVVIVKDVITTPEIEWIKDAFQA